MTATPEHVETVCGPCGDEMGWRPVPHPVGHWVARCDRCGENRAVTARRDWIVPGERRLTALELWMALAKEDAR